jgi:hypothetical protein
MMDENPYKSPAAQPQRPKRRGFGWVDIFVLLAIAFILWAMTWPPVTTH